MISACATWRPSRTCLPLGWYPSIQYAPLSLGGSSARPQRLLFESLWAVCDSISLPSWWSDSIGGRRKPWTPKYCWSRLWILPPSAQLLHYFPPTSSKDTFPNTLQSFSRPSAFCDLLLVRWSFSAWCVRPVFIWSGALSMLSGFASLLHFAWFQSNPLFICELFIRLKLDQAFWILALLEQSSAWLILSHRLFSPLPNQSLSWSHTAQTSSK